MVKAVQIAETASEKIENILMDALAAGVNWQQVNRLMDKANRQAKYRHVIGLHQQHLTDNQIAEKVKASPSAIASITTLFWNKKMEAKNHEQ